MRLLLIKPRGFCAGVIRAIATVNEALKKWGPPIYVKHEIVHNRHVINELKQKGVIFVEDLKEVPPKSRLIYSAHGVSSEIRKHAKALNLIEIDATCVLVERIHNAVTRYVKKGYKIVLAGHKKHVEVLGIFQIAPNDIFIIESIEDIKKIPFTVTEKIFFTAQTTLSVDEMLKIKVELIKKFPLLTTLQNSSICYATTNRQLALKELTKKANLILIVGDTKSANSNRLLETALKQNVKAYLINDETEINKSWFNNTKIVGMTAGASTPEEIVTRCVNLLMSYGATIEEEIFKEENISFMLPKNL